MHRGYHCDALFPLSADRRESSPQPVNTFNKTLDVTLLHETYADLKSSSGQHERRDN
jgi:hypothetical protein